MGYYKIPRYTGVASDKRAVGYEENAAAAAGSGVTLLCECVCVEGTLCFLGRSWVAPILCRRIPANVAQYQ